MQSKLSSKLIDVLLEGLKQARLSEFEKEKLGYIEMELRKSDLIGLTKDDIEFLSKYVKDYKRRVHKLRPKSLEHFLTSNKYEADDKVIISITLSELVDTGLLKKIDIEGFKYWEFAGKVLDPKEFVVIYKVDEEVYRTLFKEFGFYEIYEKFRDAINKSMFARANDPEYIAEFTYNGITFSIRRSGMTVHASVGYDLNELRHDHWVYGSILAVNKNASLWIDVSNPKSEDVFKALKYIEYTDMLVKEVVDNMRTIIKQSTGLDVDVSEFYGFVRVRDYRLDEITVSVDKSIEFGRSTIRLRLEVGYDKDHQEYVEDESGRSQRVTYPKWRTTVEAEGKLKSLYVYELFRKTGIPKNLPDDMNIGIDTENKEIALRITRDIPMMIFVDVSKPYEIARSFREVLAKIVDRAFDKLRNEEVVYRSRGRSEETVLGTFGKIIDLVKWKDTTDFDEAVLKIIALEMNYGDRLRNANIPVIDFLIAHSVINGMDQDSLTNRINNPLETMISFIESGKLRVKYENGLKIYFKGKPIENYIDYDLIPGRFGRLISTALSLANPDEAVKIRMKVSS